MAQRKKKLTKKKKHVANREQEAESDSGDFELAAEVKDDDSVSVSTSDCVVYLENNLPLVDVINSLSRGMCSPRPVLCPGGGIAQW